MSVSRNYKLEYAGFPLAWVLLTATQTAALLAEDILWLRIADQDSIAPSDAEGARKWAERVISDGGEVVTYAGSTTDGTMYFSASTVEEVTG